MNRKFFQMLLFAAFTTTLMEGAAIATCPNPDNTQCCADCTSARGKCSRSCGHGTYNREVQGSREQICDQGCTDTYYTCADAC